MRFAYSLIVFTPTFSSSREEHEDGVRGVVPPRELHRQARAAGPRSSTNASFSRSSSFWPTMYPRAFSILPIVLRMRKTASSYPTCSTSRPHESPRRIAGRLRRRVRPGPGGRGARHRLRAAGAGSDQAARRGAPRFRRSGISMKRAARRNKTFGVAPGTAPSPSSIPRRARVRRRHSPPRAFAGGLVRRDNRRTRSRRARPGSSSSGSVPSLGFPPSGRRRRIRLRGGIRSPPSIPATARARSPSH